MKKNNFITIITVGLLTLTAIASISFYASRSQSKALASGNTFQHNSSSNNQLTPVDAPANQSGTETLSQIKNDVTINVTSARIIETGAEIGICYTTLDGGDWYPMPGHLFYSTYEIYPDEFEFTTEEKADRNNTGNRCVLVRYRIDDVENITAPIQFSVLKVMAHPREMPACQNFQQRLDTNPKAKAYGLIASCSETNDGGISVTLISQDTAIEKDQANATLNAIAEGVINGPWEFTITDLQ